MSEVEEIKARVDIVDLISEYIRLKPAGPNNYRALCPFHNEKTPSFMVSRDKQIFHCFGCSEGGDIFSFVQKMEGIEFSEALRILAEKAGIKIISRDPKLFSQRNRLLEICQLATKFWHKILLESSQAEIARSYLKKRQVSEKTMSDFNLGYAVDNWDTLIKFMKGRGYKDHEIFSAGLSVKKERGNDFYDRFRGRLIFPINDLHGNPIGFSARTLKPDEKGGKYINTPQTLIYNKSLVLFNLDKAKLEIKKQDLAVIVEGQMDVLSAWQAGSENIIASSGTALTMDQISILKRYTNNLAIAFDSDLAGESAAKRGIDLALSQEINVKVIILPDGKDPDECIKKNPKNWFLAIKDAKSIIEYYFERAFSSLDLSKVEDKKKAAKILLPIIARVGNKIEQSHWLQKLAGALNVTENILRESLFQKNKKEELNNSNARIVRPKSRSNMISEQILGVIFKYPANITYAINNLEPEVFMDKELRDIYKFLIIYYTEDIENKIDNFDYNKFKPKLKSNNLDSLADRLVLVAESDFFDFDYDSVREEFIKAVKSLKKEYYNYCLKNIGIEIKEAENSNNQSKMEELINRFNEIITQINLLN